MSILNNELIWNHEQLSWDVTSWWSRSWETRSPLRGILPVESSPMENLRLAASSQDPQWSKCSFLDVRGLSWGRAWWWAEWTPPTVIPEMAIACSDAPGGKSSGPRLQNFSFPGYSPSKQANRLNTILLFFTRSSGLLRALPHELVHPCNDPVLAGGNRWAPD